MRTLAVTLRLLAVLLLSYLLAAFMIPTVDPLLVDLTGAGAAALALTVPAVRRWVGTGRPKRRDALTSAEEAS